MEDQSIEVDPENEDVFYDENDEDIQNFQKLREASRPSYDLWSRVAELSTSNSDQLAEEMWSTLREMTCFMRRLELTAKERRIKRLTKSTGDWIKFCEGEERFAESLEAGKKSMVSLSSALGLGPAQRTYVQPIELYRRISKYEDFAVGRTTRERIQELSVCLKELVGRFAKICETERVEHGLPVIAPADAPPVIESLPKMKKSSYQLPSIQVPQVKKEPESNNIVYEFGDKIAPMEPITESVSMQPVDFVWEYCRRDKSTPMYEDMGTVGKSGLSQEFVVVCRVRNLTGEGKAKKKQMAKQCAAAMLIKTLLSKQKADRLPVDARQISEEERLIAIRAMSEVLDFERELDQISGEEYHRSPIYTPLVNSSGNHVRCKALGYNAVGCGRTKAVAKRMAAKLILDLHREAKELAKKKTKQKFEAYRSSTSSLIKS